MKLKLKTKEELEKVGYKFEYNLYYFKFKKDGVTYIDRVSQVLGHEVSLLDVSINNHRGTVRLTVESKEGRRYCLPDDFFTEFHGVNTYKKSIKNLYIETEISGLKAQYNNFTENFEFPCDFSKLNKKDAKKLAKWVLKIAETKTTKKGK